MVRREKGKRSRNSGTLVIPEKHAARHLSKYCTGYVRAQGMPARSRCNGKGGPTVSKQVVSWVNGTVNGTVNNNRSLKV